jgi:hypothetical protein
MEKDNDRIKGTQLPALELDLTVEIFCCDLQEFTVAEQKEISDFIWGLGEYLRHNPRLDRSCEQLQDEWRKTHGQRFRKWWYGSRKLLDPQRVGELMNQELPEYLAAQRKAMGEYLWNKGVEMKRDPREIHSETLVPGVDFPERGGF